MIIQSICLLDQLDKDINTFSMRIRFVCHPNTRRAAWMIQPLPIPNPLWTTLI